MSETQRAMTVISEEAVLTAMVAQHGAIRADAAAAASQAAADLAFAEHWELLPQKTRLRHGGDLALFA